MKRYMITMILLILMITVSIYYAFFKNNEVEVNIEKSKYLIQHRIRNIDFDKIPLNLQVEFEKILHKNNELQLKKEWTTNLSFDLTMKPFFDLDFLYLIAYDKIIVYDKKTTNIKWKRQFDSPVVYFNLLDRNRVIACDDSSRFYNINRITGLDEWSISYKELNLPALNQNLEPFLLTSNNDKRLLNSIFFIPQKRSILLLNNDTGKLISSVDFDSDVLYISDYDSFENCIYVVTESKLNKLVLEKF